MKFLASLGRWMMALFNPPPRDSLRFYQKIGRVFLVTGALVTFSIISALIVAIGLFLFDRIRTGLAGDYPLVKVVAILLDSILVNVICVFVLLQIKRIDETLIPPADDAEAKKD